MIPFQTGNLLARSTSQLESSLLLRDNLFSSTAVCGVGKEVVNDEECLLILAEWLSVIFERLIWYHRIPLRQSGAPHSVYRSLHLSNSSTALSRPPWYHLNRPFTPSRRIHQYYNSSQELHQLYETSFQILTSPPRLRLSAVRTYAEIFKLTNPRCLPIQIFPHAHRLNSRSSFPHAIPRTIICTLLGGNKRPTA